MSNQSEKLKSIAETREKMKSVADISEKMKSIADISEMEKLTSVAGTIGKIKSIVDTSEIKSVERPDRGERKNTLEAVVLTLGFPSVDFDVGNIAAMTYGYTKDDLAHLVNGAVDLATTQNKSVLEKMDFIEVVKQFLDGTVRNAKLQSFDKGEVSGHESGLTVVRTDIANLRQPRILVILDKLLQLEQTQQKRLKYQNLKFGNYALRRLEMPLIDEDVDLVVVYCLTLACKMQSKRFHTTGFLLERGLAYNLDEVVAMELNLLRSLQWNTQQLTPFCFLQCLHHDLTASCNMRLVYSIIVWTQANMVFADFSPSTIASSAIRCSTRCEDSKMISGKLHGVKDIDECTNFMEAVYNMKLSSLRSEFTNTSEESSPSVMNIALEWIEQLPSSEAEVGIYQRALGCLFPLLQCFKADPSTEITVGPSTEINTADPSTEITAGPSTEINTGPS